MKKLSLLEANPELAKQWNPTKNGTLTPKDVTANSNKKVWWIYPYDDPETGRHFDFEWKAAVYNRSNGRGCPFLSDSPAVWPGYNDLGTKNPELSRQWHPTKNGVLTPEDVTANSGKMVWWIYPYDDPETGRHFDFEWKAAVYNRSNGRGCPFLSDSPAVWPGYNDLGTKNPELSRQWHPTKNGVLTPEDVTANSGKMVWWIYPYDDPETGRHFDFEWKTAVYNRSRGDGCPFLSSRPDVWEGFNDLQSKFPEFAEEWDSVKNRNKTPQNTYYRSVKRVWWKCPLCGYRWRDSVANRIRYGRKCPNCT